ncbi:Eco57I restriction-modification methylase domain-containing protein [Azospirillum argentinense]|uniref:site-specific DNA-methyltransferase (adenine-specific) n=1 Tax=Azospirillum brasilense TaxID=192 RepID=A0A4D8QBB5_AZOBR|nr:N-6 DNA methylase [Azospirillum argentinense]QCO03442.1 SAM-dependent DNA methyltransferase [Azospirillum argentinense]
MPTLTRERRKELEKAVAAARRVAEEGARAALEHLAVHNHEPWASLTPEQRALRNRLRAHGRRLGDRRDPQTGRQAIDRLKAECAYEHWHRMLFARFLAEADLLIEPDSGMPISLDEARELAREENRDWLELASGFAQRMLPEIFRTDDPVLEVALPPETRSALEDLLKALPAEILLADDALGWVYQFWQAERKEAVNKSGVKIGADELPAVTQLFTEDYMVLFLLHNTLGAWWAGKVLAAEPALAATAPDEDALRAACAVGGVEWTYLRFVRETGEEGEDGAPGPWRPAAGTFEGWPRHARDLTLLDPCMGSGHFLVFALPILVAFRMAEDGLTREAAVDAVLAGTLHGLEIDPRCTQIAAFNLAFAAWRLLGGYRDLPRLNLACSGMAMGVTKAEWLRLAERAAGALGMAPAGDLIEQEDSLFTARLRGGLERLYDLFAKAPVLGSLIDPRRADADIFAADFDALEPFLNQALAGGNEDDTEMAVAAQGMAKAADILSKQFVLVATNVPYLTQKRMGEELHRYVSKQHTFAKYDLATAFVQKLLYQLEGGGTATVVFPQNWLFLSSYRKLRQEALQKFSLNFVIALGEEAWEAYGLRGPLATLGAITRKKPDNSSEHYVIDATSSISIPGKINLIRHSAGELVLQQHQYRNPDSRILPSGSRAREFHNAEELSLLANYAISMRGIVSGDGDMWTRYSWELPEYGEHWIPLQSTVTDTNPFGGREMVINWRTKGKGMLRHGAGNNSYGRKGVVVSQLRSLSATFYSGEFYDNNTGVIIPHKASDLLPIWCFCSSSDFKREVRKIDSKKNVTNATLIKVPFDLDHWRAVAAEKYPDGLPAPHSSDPTQWLFNGHPLGSDDPLQVAVARLVGYRWPRQTGSSFMDCPALGQDGLEAHADTDGIVCLPSIRGEAPADDRLSALLADAYGEAWSHETATRLLAEAGKARTLDEYLRDGFFARHCELFHQRPFVWHVWDGRRDGFQALVNAHRLTGPDGEGKRTLETLTYTYLGDWIDAQRDGQRRGVEGADARLAHAEHLKAQLEAILAGEPPFDLFARWKPLHRQPIGWEPDVNDGVRINIRPFLAARPLAAKKADACILRITPRIKWDKDRGKEPTRDREDYPWFWTWDGRTQDFAGVAEFDGQRWNDLHYTTATKRAARARHDD